MKKFVIIIFLLNVYGAAANTIGVENLKLYIFYTPSHNTLVNDWFLPSLKDDFEIIAEEHTQECQSSRFLESGWIKTMTRKVDLILRAINENWGKVFIHADVDIQFFGPIQELILHAIKDKDIVLQRNQPNGDVCAGFFACRGNEKTRKLWQNVRKKMLSRRFCHDQEALNYFLRKYNTCNVVWDYLPDSFFGGGRFTGKRWQPGQSLSVPKNIVVHHANWTTGIQNKIAQLEYVQEQVLNKRGHSKNGQMKIHSYFTNLFKEFLGINIDYEVYEGLKKNPLPYNVNYLAIPWTALIKKKMLHQIPKIKLNGGFTISTDARYRQFLPILKQIGIDVLFTPHVHCITRSQGPTLVPFPHYPAAGAIPAKSKDILYSFVGFVSHPLRKKIFALPKRKNTVIIQRKRWFFAEQKEEEKNEYKNVLSRSRFALVPRGSSPGTLRFWEALQAGAIPILISDTTTLPYGFDWDSCVIKIPEKGIENIDEIIDKINPQQEKQMRKNCLKAYALYCTNNFTWTIHHFYKKKYHSQEN